MAFSRFSDMDVHLFRAGKHFNLYKKFGSHLEKVEHKKGVYFAVWAPAAKSVCVMGDFNKWNKTSHQLNVRWDSSGIWEGFIPDVKEGTIYKYSITAENGEVLEKGDPYAQYWETPPRTGSVVVGEDYSWNDKNWVEKQRAELNSMNSPISVYEMHIGSWRRNSLEGNRYLTYRELAVELTEYLVEMEFSHVEFMPVMEHPFYGSWGYQVHGYFAPSSRYGTVEDFKFLIDTLHQGGIGVFLDWVPSHFPGDAHGLYRFDGSALYEHEDPRLGFHPDWKSYIYNYGRAEVRSFLISNAMFWMDKYHADGLRVDAVASMLYLDYSRNEGEWIANKFGGRENLEAISFLKELNETIYGAFPNSLMVAEESTAYPMVSRPVFSGGLGFGMKWMMGWMNDTLEYMHREPIYRKYHHNEISFSLTYAFNENFMLPLSHDEVVHGKGTLLDRMPGDEWQKFANLRLLYGYMFTHPGAKLLFMGSEIAQNIEWNHDDSLQWHLLKYPLHKGVQQLVKDLNHLYKTQPALYEKNFEASGFKWIDYSDNENLVLAFIRNGNEPNSQLMVVCNFSPEAIRNYKVGAPLKGKWIEILNSDDEKYGGSGFFNGGILKTVNRNLHGQKQYLKLKLPPLGISILKFEKD